LFLTGSEDSPIKIIDFGLSRHKDEDEEVMKTKVGECGVHGLLFAVTNGVSWKTQIEDIFPPVIFSASISFS